jgi:segregation and condensation protein B
MPELVQQLEALLFFLGEPITIRKLAQLTGCPEDEVRHALLALQKQYENRGVRLLLKDEQALFVTAPECATLLDQFHTEKFTQELGKAALETLAIILYRSPVTRADIEYIRGVNSTFTLRTLLVRGLIERVFSSHDQRIFQYRPKMDLLKHLGISSVEEMPEFDTVKREIETFETTLAEETHASD